MIGRDTDEKRILNRLAEIIKEKKEKNKAQSTTGQQPSGGKPYEKPKR